MVYVSFIGEYPFLHSFGNGCFTLVVQAQLPSVKFEFVASSQKVRETPHTSAGTY